MRRKRTFCCSKLQAFLFSEGESHFVKTTKSARIAGAISCQGDLSSVMCRGLYVTRRQYGEPRRMLFQEVSHPPYLPKKEYILKEHVYRDQPVPGAQKTARSPIHWDLFYAVLFIIGWQLREYGYTIHPHTHTVHGLQFSIFPSPGRKRNTQNSFYMSFWSSRNYLIVCNWTTETLTTT